MASHVRPQTPPNGVHPHHQMSLQHGVHVNGMPGSMQQPPPQQAPPGPPQQPQQQPPPGQPGPPGAPGQQQPGQKVTPQHLAGANEAVWMGIGMYTRESFLTFHTEANAT